MGSKAKITKYIVPIIQRKIDESGARYYVEPFAGGCNVIDKIKAEYRIASDSNKYLIALFQHLQDGGELPEHITREEYNKAREAYRTGDNSLQAWYIGAVGFLASYNGRFYDGGYAGYGKDKGRVRDYYHAHKDNQMYKLLKGGTRKLKQSLISVITTAGFNLNAPCYELYKYCRRVLRGIDVNDRQFIYIAQMDVNDDIWNPKNWIKCCPLTGNDPELLSQMQEDAKKAKSMGGEEMRDFLTKSLNIWVTNAETAFIDLAEWEKCGSNRTLEDFRGKKAICGLDLSSGGDLTSLALIFPYEDPNTGDKKYYIYSHSFIPQRRMQEHMDKEDNAPYIIWQKEGLLTVTTAAGGIKTDYKTILAHLHNIIDKYDIDLTAIGYDPHNASAFLLDLEDFGCDLVEIKQSARSLNDATIDFQLEVKAHNVEYDKKNKLLTRSMNDAILSEPNSFGEIKIDKMLQKVRIDPCDAIIDAHKLAMGVEVEEITTDQSIEAYLKMFEKAGVKED